MKFTTLFTFLFMIHYVSISHAVIYGEDSFMDIDQITNKDLIKRSNSVAGIINYSSIKENFDIDKYVGKRTLLHRSICPYEKFVKQTIRPTGSAFLIAPDLVMSVGHTLSTKKKCLANYSFVFNYSWNSGKQNLNSLKKDDLYFCKDILEFSYSNIDYSIIRLDRPVNNIQPVSLDFTEKNREDEKIYTIGHPNMTPKKYSDGYIRSNIYEGNHNYYNASIDSMRGNSGSPVFHMTTNKVIAIIKGGEADLIFDEKYFCNAYKKCEDNECRGEAITKISSLPKEKINKHIKMSYERYPKASAPSK